jgi:Ran GTPase-activating protein (RanGAP) involved in mRNA processing and transport
MRSRWFGPGVVEVLAKLPALVDLELESGELGNPGATLLARIPQPLAALRLGNNDIGPSGGRALASAAFAPSLTLLDLESNPLGDEGGCAIASSTRFDQLATLSLKGHWDQRFGPATAEAIARGPLTATLETLDLTRSRIGAAGAAALANAPFAKLARLRLADAAIGDDGLIAIARSELLAKVRSIDLADNGITDAGAAALCSLDIPLDKLAYIHLGNAKLGAETTRHLVDKLGARVHVGR